MRTLVLCHRIPYPPDKGEKIRAWHLLRGLAERSEVLLGAFVDDPADWRETGPLRELCSEVMLRPLSPRRARLRSLLALPGSRPLSVAYYDDAAMRRWVSARIGQVDAVLAYSSAMAQYVPERCPEGLVRVADYVDVDSEKWRQYGEEGGVMAAVYRLEARRLAAFERAAAHRFQHVLFVSDDEAACFLRRAPEHAERVAGLPNGVDTAHFSPDAALANPYEPGPQVAVFTGAMDYRPNVDAVLWFAREVLPRVRDRVPGARFCIVGLRPAAEVQALKSLPGVSVTGRVPDVRPYLRHGDVAVAPLRMARGVQNKVLEAMAMARPVVATPAALEGLNAPEDAARRAPADAAAFAEAVTELMGDRGLAQVIAGNARRHVEGHHGWAVSQARLAGLLGLPAGSLAIQRMVREDRAVP